MIKAAARAALAVLVLALPGLAQVPASKPAGTPPPALLTVFLDWPGADIEAIRAEIPFVAFVPSPDGANVRVVVAPLGPPPEGRLRIEVAGLGEFQGQDNVLTYAPGRDEKPGEVRKGVTALVRLGLLRYAAKTAAAKDLSIKFLDQAKPTAVNDRWNFWVFSLSGNAFLSGETQYRSHSYYASVSANRTTPALKIRTQVYGNWSGSWFDLGDGTSYESSTHGRGASGMVVKSLGRHWSAGGYLEAEASTYSNLKMSLSAAPALEYDVFPYSESTRRQLRILYRIGLTRTRYYEETVYFKTSETLFQEALSVAYEAVQPWGKVSLQIEGSHFFHNVKFNRVELEGGLEFRIWRGLSLELDGSYSRIRDQIALSAAGYSYEDILLQQKQLATGFDYSFSVGLSFSFGSTRSNVVNPRFGNGGRSISISL